MTRERSLFTRLLHFALLAVVLNQLIGSNIMERPLPGEDPGLAFTLHSWVGMAGFVLVLAFWLWTLFRRGETRLRQLVPWFSRRGWAGVIADIRHHIHSLMRLRLPEDDGHGALASAVHGLGLLILTVMAATGTAYALLLQGTDWGRPTLFVHATVANLMWAYLIGHAGLAVLHHLAGSDIFSRMFWRRAGRLPQPAGARQ